MANTKTYTLEDQIIYQMADLTITEVAKQLEFCATEAHQSAKTIAYTQALKAYFIERIQAL
jgi:D-hexose-6-phosphate mutarotase